MTQNATNLKVVNNADGYDIAGGNTARKLSLIGADVILTGNGSNVYTFPASTSTLLATNGLLSALTGTISSAVLANSTIYIGTTGIALNRGTAALTLAGITLTTPVLGVATATSINKITITQPASSGTLTIENGFTLTVNGNGSISGANTGDQNLSGKADVDQTMYIGSIAVAINRTTGTLNLAGIGTLGVGAIISSGCLTITETVAGALKTQVRHINSSNTVGTGARASFRMLDSNSAIQTYGRISTEIDVNTAGGEDGTMRFSVIGGGAFDDLVILDGSSKIATFAGAISSTNLSGNNTGDQDLSGKEDVGVASGLMTTHTTTHPVPTTRDARNQVIMGADDNYVTDSEKTVIGNTSGANTGDNTVCTSGTATTASTLATPRAINGVNFDGSAAINIQLAIDHGTAATDQLVNVCYGTSATPPTANTTTIGALYVQYTA